MRLLAGLALAAALVAPWVAPAPVEAGYYYECPPNYGGAHVGEFANHPLRRAAAKADKNQNRFVCFKYGGPGPQFVDDLTYIDYP